ncbi:MAG: DNA glycosylase [Peptostreptococcales bacterium]
MKDFIKIKNIKDFNLTHIFECGQCFRWYREEDGSYTGVVFNRVINISQEKGDLIIKNTNGEDFEGIWRSYFDLDRDYGSIKMKLSEKDDIMGATTEFGQGIRLLNQEPWETLISFIISQNRNIPTIKKNIEKISEKYGSYLGNYNTKDYYAFPSPEMLADTSIDSLAECGVGYRAKYIISAAQMASTKSDFLSTGQLTDEELEQHLLSIHGVGPKVANCIMLFGMKRYKRFPIDVWIERVMKELYGLENKIQVQRYADENFKDLGGFAQQYLFYYAREKKIGQKKK